MQSSLRGQRLSLWLLPALLAGSCDHLKMFHPCRPPPSQFRNVQLDGNVCCQSLGELPCHGGRAQPASKFQVAIPAQLLCLVLSTQSKSTSQVEIKPHTHTRRHLKLQNRPTVVYRGIRGRNWRNSGLACLVQNTSPSFLFCCWEAELIYYQITYYLVHVIRDVLWVFPDRTAIEQIQADGCCWLPWLNCSSLEFSTWNFHVFSQKAYNSAPQM